MGAGIATGLLALKTGIIAGAKKSAHHTKEQKAQEQRLTHGLNLENEKLQNNRMVAENAPWYSWRKYKAKRQIELYQETTQQNIADTTKITNEIQHFLVSPKLDDQQKAVLTSYMVEGLSRLDAYGNTGHNFLGSQERTKVEPDLRNLYHAVLEAAKKLQPHLQSASSSELLGAFRASNEYQTLNDALREDYQSAFDNFKKRRRNLTLKYGI